MLSVQDAQTSLLSIIRPLPGVNVSCLESLGAILAEDVYADIANPPFDNSAVDGYAVIATETAGASQSTPRTFDLLEEIAAGASPVYELRPGKCSKIMTGAPIPPGADAVVMIEDTVAAGSKVRILQPASPGEHVRRRGEDIHKGDRVLAAGTLIKSPEIAILAAMGQSRVTVHRRPSVAVITTGDELVDIDQSPSAGQIRNSNAYAVAAMIAESGAEVHSIQRVRDDEGETESALSACVGADIIVTSGGVSVGDRDYVKPAVEKLGALSFWRVNMKPGKPIAVGTIGDSFFFGLPGNPISTMVTFELFVRPAIRKLMGFSDPLPPRVTATLNEELTRSPGREEYIRATLTLTESGFAAQTTGGQGSGMLRSMAGANALLVIPADIRRVSKGESVTALLLHTPAPASESI